MDPAINPDYAQHVERNVQTAIKMNHFQEVCRSARDRAVHNIEQEPDQEEENHIDIVNINSINFDSSHSIITAHLKTSSIKVIGYFLGQQKSSW